MNMKKESQFNENHWETLERLVGEYVDCEDDLVRQSVITASIKEILKRMCD